MLPLYLLALLLLSAGAAPLLERREVVVDTENWTPALPLRLDDDEDLAFDDDYDDDDKNGSQMIFTMAAMDDDADLAADGDEDESDLAADGDEDESELAADDDDYESELAADGDEDESELAADGDYDESDLAAYGDEDESELAADDDYDESDLAADDDYKSELAADGDDDDENELDGEDEGDDGFADDDKELATPKDQCSAAPLSNCYSICCSLQEGAEKKVCFDQCTVVETGNRSSLHQLAAQTAAGRKGLTQPLESASQNVRVSEIVTAIVLIITGLVFVFFGHRLFRPILFLAGFYVFGVLAYSALIAIETNRGAQLFGTNRDWLFIVIVIVAGVIGGSLFACLWKLGLFAIGLLLGFTLGSFILGLISNGAIQSEVGRIIFLSVFALAGGIAILFFERVLLVLGTAFPGSYAVFFGIDLFAKTGFKNGVQTFISGQGVYNATAAVYGMLVGVVLLAIIGCVYQFRDTSRKSMSKRSAESGNPGGGYSGVAKF
ncbi:MAG: hypothetical protein SGCHY_002629 [Lobulomycetales sp.]